MQHSSVHQDFSGERPPAFSLCFPDASAGTGQLKEDVLTELSWDAFTVSTCQYQPLTGLFSPDVFFDADLCSSAVG